ncbi:cysteine proteinase [Tilletiopsis washingtonensis]|uniref:Cysteine proteinase n=1 Tax=Tilletiopsis washingtonensis TaxID=58919 RepID=A0A316ZCC6_9BASI|nr:cysteine proteinase [Tilletiopsis washingtonensis]PWN98966.1 cysteine proteinase [Tilletiopsis washingtonensis]
MPSRKKKSQRGAPLPPGPSRTDSLRADVYRNVDNGLETNPDAFAAGEDDDALDLADQLLATLDARDAEAAGAQEAGTLPVDKAAAGSAGHTESHRKLSSSLKEASGRLFSRSPEKPEEGDDSQARRRSFGHSAGEGIRKLLSGGAGTEAGEGKGGKVNRAKARLARRDAEQAAMRSQAEAELRANGAKPDEAERERRGIEELCRALNVTMREINPDGHCLYAAVADQLNSRGKVAKKVDFRDTRRATAEHMRGHADDFMPFISDSDEHMAGIQNTDAGALDSSVKGMTKHFMDYCDAVENTGVWGGQPEILALSRAYKTQIHVVQAGSPVLKVGEGEQKGEPLQISYHRKMYGLGEHYNSLHKASKK